MAKLENEKKSGLLSTNAEVEAVGVIYNVTGSLIQDFVYNYLTQIKGLDGIAAIRAHVIRDGSQNPELGLYVILNSNSKDVITNMNNIPKHIRNKMDVGGFRASDKLKQAMYPLCKEFKVGVHKQGLLYVKCDVFKVLGIMLDADPRVHKIVIPEIIRIRKKNSIVTVIKSNKFVDRDDATTYDRFSQVVEDIEGR